MKLKIATATPSVPRVHSIILPGWHRRSLYAVFVLLMLSGLAWLLGYYFLRQEPELPHSLEAVAMKVHGAAAMLALLVYGSLLPTHVRLAWRLGRNRGSGLILGLVSVALALTGYGLWYLAGEASRYWWSLLHWVPGVVLPMLLIWHILAGRKARRAVAAEVDGQQAQRRA